MPFFTKKSPTPFENNNHKSSTTTNNILSTASQLPLAQHIIEKKLPSPQIDAHILKPQLIFHCQLAHGSPTGLISGFGSVKELYQKIAECYDFSVDEVRYSKHNINIMKLIRDTIKYHNMQFLTSILFKII